MKVSRRETQEPGFGTTRKLARGKTNCACCDNGGGWVPYRTSKAALNMAWSCLALEANSRGIAAVLLSPGWVKTRMGGAGAEITSQQSVSDMRALIDRVTIADTGKFLRRDGSELPW